MAEPAIATVPTPTPAVEPVVVPTPTPVPTPTELGTPTPAVDPVAPILDADGKPIPPKVEDKKSEPAAIFDPAKLALPEGMKSDDPLFQEFAGTLADAKLDPQTRGQKLLDVYTKGVKTIQDAQKAAWDQVNDTWVKQVKADPEIGGAKFDTTKTTIAKAIDSLGPELSVAFRQGLDATGAGNHPAIWKGLAKMAALLTEGGHVTGGPKVGERPTIKEAFYPNSPDMK